MYPAGRSSACRLPAPWSRKPPIYIFDDSFSALDFKTDSALRKALKEKTGDSTVLIVTQRVATIKNAEQIIVLDEGRGGRQRQTSGANGKIARPIARLR